VLTVSRYAYMSPDGGASRWWGSSGTPSLNTQLRTSLLWGCTKESFMLFASFLWIYLDSYL